jgi:hypothetical protein
MTQIRKGYVQVNAAQLAAFLAMVDSTVHQGHANAKEVRPALDQLRRRIRNKNQTFMNSTTIMDFGARAIFKTPSDPQLDLENKQYIARRIRELCHNVGREIHFRWNGNLRTGVIKGRVGNNKQYLSVFMPALPQSQCSGNFTMRDSITAGMENCKVHYSIMARDANDNVQLTKKAEK